MLGHATFGATSRAVIQQLQQALRTLGQLVRDPVLQIKPDGIVGPATRRAVNAALVKYMARTAPARIRKGNLTINTITKHADDLFNRVTAEVTLRRKGRTVAADTEVPAALRPGPAPAPAPAPRAAPAPSGAKAVVAAMQRAVADLGRRVKDRNLAKIAADGIVGPMTRAAVNTALSKYAPSPLRPPLSIAQIRATAKTITDIVNAAQAPDRRPLPPQALVRPQEKPASKADIRRLQAEIAALGKLVNNAALQIAADGIVGPNTAAALNTVFKLAAPQVPPDLRGKRLTVEQIKGDVVRLASIVNQIRGRAEEQAEAEASQQVAKQQLTALVARMQRALVGYGRRVGDERLQVTATGIIDEPTLRAINATFTRHITEPVGFPKKSSYNEADVKKHAYEMTLAIEEGMATTPMPALRPVPPPAPAPTPVQVPEDDAPEPAPEDEPVEVPPEAPIPAPVPAARRPAPRPAPAPQQYPTSPFPEGYPARPEEDEVRTEVVTPAPAPQAAGGLSTGAIIGIAAGGAVLVGGIVYLATRNPSPSAAQTTPA